MGLCFHIHLQSLVEQSEICLPRYSWHVHADPLEHMARTLAQCNVVSLLVPIEPALLYL